MPVNLTDYGYAAKRQIADDIADPHAERVRLIIPTTGSQWASLIDVKTHSSNSKAVGKNGKTDGFAFVPHTCRASARNARELFEYLAARRIDGVWLRADDILA